MNRQDTGKSASSDCIEGFAPAKPPNPLGKMMVIECSVCKVRYRMRGSIMRGFRGAKVRCRKCGGISVIMNLATAHVPASPDAPAYKPRLQRPGIPPGERAEIPTGKEGLAPRHIRRDPLPGEREKQSGTELEKKPVIEKTVPAKVVLLKHFQGANPRRLPASGFDISSHIRPEPSSPLTKAEQDLSSTPPSAFVEKDSTANRNQSKPIALQKEGSPLSIVEDSVPASQDTTRFRRHFLSNRQPRSKTLRPLSSRISDISFALLLLLLAGGVGFLLFHIVNLLIIHRFD